MWITFIRLATAALLPVLFAVVFYLAERKTRFAKLSYAAKQTIIGVVFGAIAVLATEFGIPVDGAVLNVRTAAPLTAGLVFGGPAGIIAGVIGGVERWFATLWGVGAYSRVACTIATILAGLFAAVGRRHMFDNKKPSWFYGLAIGITTEVLHMLILFLTNINDIHTAFIIVTKCALPMIAANALSVTLALLAVSWIGKEKIRRRGDKRQISQVFQVVLLICVTAAFIVTSLFTSFLQTRIAYTDTDELLRLNIEDVKSDIGEASDNNLLALARNVAEKVEPDSDGEQLAALAEEYDVAEINIIDQDGIIIASTQESFINYDMADGEQSAEFLCLLDGADEFVQSYQPISYDASTSRKYAGIALKGGGFVQVGYDAGQFQADIAEQVVHAAKNRHVGQGGTVIICDESFTIVSDGGGNEGETLGYDSINTDIKSGVRFKANVNGVECYCAYGISEGYYIVSAIPVKEAMFSRDLAVYIIAFMEILVFAALFVNIYFLIKRVVVDNIHKINTSLAQITGGNLNVTVNVRENEEFASLSDDINSTVTTLKHYIAEAAARIDKELEFARQIQKAALPSVFPPFPSRRDFDIYALMDAAKEVGGDFYDFYLLDNDRLGFLIADVSGKGIPAAMFMMTSKTLIKGFAESGMETDDIFTQANEKLCEGNDAGMFVTAWIGVLDLRTGILRYSNAGHNPPLMRHKDGGFEYLRSSANFILAGMEGTRYKKQELQLAPGDEIYLYTDGVTEATDGEKRLFGEDRLLSVLNANPNEDVESRCKNVLKEIDMFVGDAEQFDDITMLSVKLNHLQTFDRIVVSPDLASTDAVWDFIDFKLRKAELSKKLANKVRICVDEIYSNILRYSGASKAEIFCRVDESLLTIAFRDDGTPYDPTAAKQPDVTLSAEEREIGGLGIFMVKKSARSMKYEYENGQNVLTLTFGVSE